MSLNDGQFAKYGTSLPGATKKRSMKEWNARAAVLAAGRAGSIKFSPKSKKKGK